MWINRDSTRTRLWFFFNDLDLTRTRTLETQAWTRTRGIVTRLQHWDKGARPGCFAPGPCPQLFRHWAHLCVCVYTCKCACTGVCQHVHLCVCAHVCLHLHARACVHTHHTVTLVAVVEPGRPAAVEQSPSLVQTLAAGPVVTAGTAGEVLPGVPTVTCLPPAVGLAILRAPRSQREGGEKKKIIDSHKYRNCFIH